VLPRFPVPEGWFELGKLNKKSDAETNISRLLHKVQQNRGTYNLILKEEHFNVGSYSTELSTQNKTNI
jgi:hypothetical protein